METRFILNGREICTQVQPTKALVDFLREDMKLTGVKKGCDIGECGACAVLLDNTAVSSCMVMLGQVEGRTVTTIEGLDQELMGMIEKEMLKAGAVQCGFCTPGMVMAIVSLLYKNQSPGREEIRRAIDGNLCRCTGYQQIIEAAEKMKLPVMKKS